MAVADVDMNLENLLRQIATEQGFKKYNLQITPISTGGANYSSTLYTAKVEDDENIINLFTKVALITREALAAMGFEDKSVYDGERYFYSDVSKLFKKIEDKHNIWTEKDRYILPKYYGASMETSKEMLVLEDLAAKGFTTYDRFKSVDWPYASSAVKELAKFHALSIAFEKEKPQMYKSFVDKYKVQAYNEDIFKSVFVPSFKLSIAAVREENREKLKTFLDNIKFADIVKIYQPENMKVLVHSDFRPSNLMHKYREDGTIQVIPLDYQTYQDGCPVSDLMYFIFIGSDEEFRREYFDKLLDHYYTELSAAMTRLGLDKSLYSREDFNNDLKEKLKYGLVMAAQLLPVITVDPKEAPSVTEGMTAFAQIKTSEALVDRINGDLLNYLIRTFHSKDIAILPKYYGASMETSKEMLVLEDLAAKGFTTYDRFKSVDWPYASSAVKELAKFHALSIAFEKEKPQMYKSFVDKYKVQAYNEDIFKSVFVPSFKLSIAAVREENREKLKTFLDNITFADIVKIYQPENMKVLVHSDFRPSNLMHKYREDGTIQVIPLDYQTYQDGCPVSDLMYFIFIGSDEEFRREYFDKLLDHYYTELSAAMTRLGLDKSLYSREDFNNDLKEKLKYGLVMAAQLLPVITVDPKEAPSVTEGMTAFAQIKTSEALVDRINGVVNDYIKWGIL